MRSEHAALAPLRLAWGVTLLLAPDRVLECWGDPPGETVRIAARVLGARHLAEGLLQLASAGQVGRSWTRGVDAIHAATMLPLALRGPVAYRHAALISLIISGAFAALD